MRRVHFGGYRCGGKRRASNTSEVADVTCNVCVRRLWRDVAIAHYRAFGASPLTDHGRRIRNAVRDSESATRGRTTR